jgi:pyruvate carboxylase
VDQNPQWACLQVVPGTSGPVTNADQAREFVQQHGTPIILKAAYGGGGRGMRRVDKAEDVRVSRDDPIA